MRYHALGEEILAMDEEILTLGEEILAMGEEILALGEEILAMGEGISGVKVRRYQELHAMGEELHAMGEDISGVTGVIMPITHDDAKLFRLAFLTQDAHHEHYMSRLESGIASGV